MRTTKKTARGFSIIEGIVYVAIIVITMTITVDTILNMTRWYGSLRAARLINSAALSILGRFVHETRSAYEIDMVGSTFGSHPGMLALRTYSASGLPTTRTFYLSGSTLMINEGGVPAGALIPEDAVVESLIFYKIDTGSSEAVRMELIISANTGTATTTETFYATAVLRGSY